MSHADFVHLRVHTAYSLLEGAIKVDDLVKQCQGMHMPAVAMTDTGNMFGALEFSKTCAAKGIQPIVGCQLGLTPYRSGDIENAMLSGNGAIHQIVPDQIVLLAQNQEGYDNVLKLVSEFHLSPDGGDDPRISLEFLEHHSKGLIALTGGPLGGVGRLLAESQDDAAEELLLRLKKSFEGRLYVELQRHNLEVEFKIETALIDLAYKHDLPLVATNECFFAAAELTSPTPPTTTTTRLSPKRPV